MDNVKLVVTFQLPGVICTKGKKETFKPSGIKRLELSEDQYEYMTSDESKPMGRHLSNRLKRVNKYWKRMNKEKRLEFHLGELADTLRYDYKVIT